MQVTSIDPSFPYPWISVDEYDYQYGELEDGTLLSGYARVVYPDGRTEHFGIVESSW